MIIYEIEIKSDIQNIYKRQIIYAITSIYQGLFSDGDHFNSPTDPGHAIELA